MSVEQSTSNETPLTKRPLLWLALVLSILMSGLGLLYCGKWKIALICTVLNLAVWVAIYAVIFWGPNWMLSSYLPWIIGSLLIVINVAWTWIVARPQNIQQESRSVVRLVAYPIWIISVVGAVIGIQWLFGLPKSFVVPSAAMEDGLLVGERFIATMNTYRNTTPIMGDLVIFLWPGDGKTQYVKRCVGLPGDTIVLRDTVLYVNGQPQANPPTVKFIDEYGHRSRNAQMPTFLGQNLRDYFGPYVVPQNSYFMLGDNRDNSSDSRVWGPVRAELLLGKAIRVVFSPNPERVGRFL